MLNAENKKFFNDIYSGRRKYSFYSKITNKLRRPFYKALGESIHYYTKMVLSNEVDLKYLELGIGIEGIYTQLGERGSFVTAIDISEEAILRASNEVSKRTRHHDNITFLCENAESTKLPDSSYDIIYGKWILHHLKVPAVMREIKRLLKPGGRAIFLEPLGYNPCINLFRILSPGLRVQDEHPLNRKDLNMIKMNFKHVDFAYYHLLFFLVPFFSPSVVTRWENKLIQHVPSLGPLSWQVCMILSDPVTN